MRRTLLLSLLVVGAVVALAIGSYSALAGAGPVTSVAGAVIGADGPDSGNDAEGEDGDNGDNGDNGEGAQGVAQAIAETFKVNLDEVMALHDGGVGFGAIFKLHLLSAAGAGTVEELQAAAEEDGGFAFGKHFKELSGEGAGGLGPGSEIFGRPSCPYLPLQPRSVLRQKPPGRPTLPVKRCRLMMEMVLCWPCNIWL